MRIAARVAPLVVLWLLAWGDASAANVLSGVALALALVVAFPLGRVPPSGARFHPLGVVRLLAYVLGQLVTSNVLVTREILSPRSRVRTGVIAYPLRQPSDAVITLMANVIALTPGTMTVEATREPPVLYVHFLLLDDVAAARRAIARLEDVVIGALGRSVTTTNTPPAGGSS